MQGVLTAAQRNYVISHLEHQVCLNGISSYFLFAGADQDLSGITNNIVFRSSSASLQADNVIWIDEIPILFPVGQTSDLYYTDERQNVIFRHDILKSAFYLLSGYQEYTNTESADQLGRFSFEDSIQFQLHITHKPVVNHYFLKIVEGIERFCAPRNLPVKKKRLFRNFGFILSHDVDSVDLYTRNYLLYKVKEVLKVKKSRLSTATNLRLLLRGSLIYSGVKKRENPHWNFDYMRNLERIHNFRSVFYFLDTGVLHSDAYYRFDEKRIVNLFQSLINEQCEIGLHGPVRSIADEAIMKESLEKLRRYSNATVVGIRQHRLLWKHPETAKIQSAAGLQYDTTLGFAAHEGFRNSYCLPFRLYDFEKDCPIDLWEFPLNVMDVTLFAYRNYTSELAIQKSMNIVGEIKKFGGVFSLLWHNSFFDEETYPGVTNTYEQLLHGIAAADPENILGAELLERLMTLGNHE